MEASGAGSGVFKAGFNLKKESFAKTSRRTPFHCGIIDTTLRCASRVLPYRSPQCPEADEAAEAREAVVGPTCPGTRAMSQTPVPRSCSLYEHLRRAVPPELN